VVAQLGEVGSEGGVEGDRTPGPDLGGGAVVDRGGRVQADAGVEAAAKSTGSRAAAGASTMASKPRITWPGRR